MTLKGLNKHQFMSPHTCRPISIVLSHNRRFVDSGVGSRDRPCCPKMVTHEELNTSCRTPCPPTIIILLSDDTGKLVVVTDCYM